MIISQHSLCTVKLTFGICDVICQYLIDFIHWPSQARGRTFFLHSGTNVVKSVYVIVIRLRLFDLHDCPVITVYTV